MQLFVKGLLDLFILAECSQTPVSGKHIIDNLDLISGWKPSPGAIYPLLRKLEKSKFIVANLAKNKGRREILYIITKSGKKELEEKKKIMVNCIDETMDNLTPIVMKVLHDLTNEEVIEAKKEMQKIAEIRKSIFRIKDKNERRRKIMNLLAGLNK